MTVGAWLASITLPGEWERDALCREHPELDWFPDSTVGLAEVRAVCARCSVQGECLAYALDNEIEHGVWGGTSARERRRLSQRPKRARTHVDELAALRKRIAELAAQGMTQRQIADVVRRSQGQVGRHLAAIRTTPTTENHP